MSQQQSKVLRKVLHKMWLILLRERELQRASRPEQELNSQPAWWK